MSDMTASRKRLSVEERHPAGPAARMAAHTPTSIFTAELERLLRQDKAPPSASRAKRRRLRLPLRLMLGAGAVLLIPMGLQLLASRGYFRPSGPTEASQAAAPSPSTAPSGERSRDGAQPGTFGPVSPVGSPLVDPNGATASPAGGASE